MADGSLRLDKFLWFARLAKTRPIAQTLIAQGHIRIDGRRVDRASASVRVGNVLSLPLHGHVRVLRIETLPARRGGASEARTSYTDLLAPAPSELTDTPPRD